jgi:hypothetical protein
VRLDHLLSKEQLARLDEPRPQAGTERMPRSGAHGVERRHAPSGLAPAEALGTLLGPEGSVDSSSGRPASNHEDDLVGGEHGVRSRPYLENCTVDASIKQIFVVKLVRAFGGCLGIRSRRRTWEPAISLGELVTELRAEDVRIGKPGASHVAPCLPEHIGQCKGTWGSETSQYPQEEKTTVIPSVVASERGTGQTGYVPSWQALRVRGSGTYPPGLLTR